jgi:hypothetical protein
MSSGEPAAASSLRVTARFACVQPISGVMCAVYGHGLRTWRRTPFLVAA